MPTQRIASRRPDPNGRVTKPHLDTIRNHNPINQLNDFS